MLSYIEVSYKINKVLFVCLCAYLFKIVQNLVQLQRILYGNYDIRDQLNPWHTWEIMVLVKKANLNSERFLNIELDPLLQVCKSDFSIH